MREFLIKFVRPAFIRDLNAVLKSQWYSAEQIAAEQNRKFINLIDHCRQQVPYYQKDIELISQNVQDKFGLLTEVSIQILDKIPPSPGGKHQWIISEVSPYD